MMSRIWLIARHHFLFEARKRTFWVLLFSLPLLLALTVGLGVLGERLNRQVTRLGYVDPAGFLTDTTLDSEDAVLQQFDTAVAAQTALENEEIDAYYVLAVDFETSRNAEFIYFTTIPYQVQFAFEDMVRRNHLADYPPAVAERALTRVAVTVHALDQHRNFNADPTLSDFLPLFVAVIVAFLAMTTSGYLMEVLVKEKENRTMEIVVSSVSAGKLMTGKILGGVGIAAMQLLVWLACLVAAVVIGRAAGVSWLMELNPRWRDILQMVIISVPAFFFLASFFTAVGSMMTESSDAQQMGSIAFLVMFAPFFMVQTIVENPQGWLALVLSFLPPTAVTTFALRMLVSSIPWWQVFVSFAISLVCTLGMALLAAKAFRLGMLHYGKPLRLAQLFGRAATTG
ncbi:MAG TPA: ABC transporter permease [Chloroflexota bacterium]|nr:ABC transporter permease [Chloroflexota bacterium]